MKKAILFLCITVILTSIPSLGMADSVSTQEVSDVKVIEVLNQFAVAFVENGDKPVESILRGWETYLEDSAKHTNAEYFSVLNDLTVEYHESVIQIGECTTTYQSEQKASESSWVDRLISKMGKSYIKKNKLAVKQCLFALNARNTAEACRAIKMEAIYIEAQRNEAFRKYFDLFARYVETLPKQQQGLVDGKKKSAEKIIQLMERKPLRGLYGDSYINAKLHLKTAKNRSEPQLYAHFLNEKVLAKPFDVLQAVHILDAKIR